MKRSLILHPFLFALSPILSLYLHNLAQAPVSLGELVLPVTVVWLAAAVLWGLFGIVLRDWSKAGLIVTMICVLCFSYGLVFSTWESEPKQHQSLLLLELLLLLVVAVVLVIRSRGNLRPLTVILNVVSGTLIATNLVAGLPALAGNWSRAASEGTAANQQSSFNRAVPRPANDSLPDIYYIILDTYARSDVLRTNFGYDNSDFIRHLTQNGFYVVSRGHSNYPATYFSLASSLNSIYLDSLAARSQTESGFQDQLIQMIGHSRVAEFLKRHGYTVVSFASGFTGTDLADADVHVGPRWALSEFQYVLLNTTIIPPLLNSLAGYSLNDLHRQRILFTLQNIPHAAQGRHPAFVFAHVVCPHAPFVFGAHGERVGGAPYSQMNDAGQSGSGGRTDLLYHDQTTYLTGVVQEMVDRILAQSPVSPVIILQGDHGAWGGRPPDPTHTRRFANLNAIRIPESPAKPPAFTPHSPSPYDSMTPLNTFRILLSRYFDTTVALLPDRSYLNLTGAPLRFPDQGNSSVQGAPDGGSHRSLP